MRFLRRSLVGLLLVAVALGLLGMAGLRISDARQERLAQESRERPARERVFAVNVVAFEPGTVQPVLTSFGEVRSYRTLELRTAAPGAISMLSDNVVEGGQVAAGELLLEVDPSDAQSALDIAITDLAEAEAEARDAEVARELAKEDLKAAEEQRDLRVASARRTKDLFDRNIADETTYENAVLAEASAKQAVIARRQSLAQSEARIASAATAISRADISLAEAKRRLSETKLVAEFAGTLSNVSVVKGGLLQNNERIADLVDPSSLEVSFRVSNAEYTRLLDDAGQLIPSRVTVTLDASGLDLSASGTISRESAAVGEGQTGRLLFARLENTVGFRPGDFVAVSLNEPEMRFAVALPATAVDAASTVLVLGAEDRLEEAPVRVFRRQGDEVIVRSRELSGREIVAERSPLLGVGIKVRPLRSGDSTEPEAPAMVELTPERRAKLVAFVEANKRMPAEAKKRVLSALEKPQVPAQMIERLESRMGG